MHFGGTSGSQKWNSRGRDLRRRRGGCTRWTASYPRQRRTVDGCEMLWRQSRRSTPKSSLRPTRPDPHHIINRKNPRPPPQLPPPPIPIPAIHHLDDIPLLEPELAGLGRCECVQRAHARDDGVGGEAVCGRACGVRGRLIKWTLDGMTDGRVRLGREDAGRREENGKEGRK